MQPRSQGTRSVGRVGENPGNEVVVYVLFINRFKLLGFTVKPGQAFPSLTN